MSDNTHIRVAYSASSGELKSGRAPKKCEFIVTNKDGAEIYKGELTVNSSVSIQSDQAEVPYKVEAVGQGLSQTLNDPNMLVMCWIANAAYLTPCKIQDPNVDGALWIGYSYSVNVDNAPSTQTFTIQNKDGETVQKAQLRAKEAFCYKTNADDAPYTVTAEGQGLTETVTARYSTVFVRIDEADTMMVCPLINPIASVFTGQWVDSSGYTVSVTNDGESQSQYTLSCNDPEIHWNGTMTLDLPENGSFPTKGSGYFHDPGTNVKTNPTFDIEQDGTVLKWSNGVTWQKQ